jgi:predicted transcriptional regulator
MDDETQPTPRELEILKILWRTGEATVREVYEAMRESTRDGESPIAQNTVQAFLRTMEQKKLVQHRTQGRTFIYRPVPRQEQTVRRMARSLLDRVFDGAMDQVVASLFSARRPTPQELRRLEALIEAVKMGRPTSPKKP